MRLVILESPYRGKTPEETEGNKLYAKHAMLDALHRGDSPLASHLLWPGILDDAKPEERRAGIEAGLAWGRMATATVVYTDLGISEGMRQGILHAREGGRPVEFRRLQTEERLAPGRASRARSPVNGKGAARLAAPS